MGWLIALGILFLLAILPLGVSVQYDSDGPLVRIIAGLLRLQVFPAKKKKKPKEKTEKKGKTPKEESAAPQETAEVASPQKEKTPAKTDGPAPQKGGSITDFIPLVWTVLDFLVDFRRKLRVNRLELNLVMAGGDPCDLATNYGKAWAALGNLWPRLEEWFVIKKRDVRIQCDFESDQTLVTARLDITITLGRILSLGVRYGIRAIKELIQIKNKGKGGAAL